MFRKGCQDWFESSIIGDFRVLFNEGIIKINYKMYPMKHLEFELAIARSKKSQGWAFTLFLTAVIMNFPLTKLIEYWGIWPMTIFYCCLIASAIFLMGGALYFSYRIKKLERSIKGLIS